MQVEIFLQYSLQSKALERLERLAQLFPGEEDRNERLRALYERANWWPKGAPRESRLAAGASRRQCRRRKRRHRPPLPLPPTAAVRQRKKPIAILQPSPKSTG